MSFTLQWLAALLAAYLIGAIPFGLIIGLARGIDVRTQGSGNIGATNVRRVVGKAWGNLAFALDLAKGAAPVLAFGSALDLLGHAALPAPRAFALIAIGAAAILGHMFPVYLRFKGGKGVATGLGALTALWPGVTPAAILALATWLAVLRTTRMVSVSSCAAAAALPIAVLVLALVGWPDPDASPATRLGAAWPYLTATIALAALVIWKHRANLARVRAGTEPKIGRHPDSRTVPENRGPTSLDSEKPEA